ncbi:DsrE family protein [Streptomyces coerulescens]|uniref:DsrE family protein n=1 Tax=Streptomyces coerulescens TaxID=29304 RepID=A0ABW0CLY8_STRCD
MTGFVLIESNGRESGPGCARFLTDATALARAGHPVRVVLLQEGVTAALPGALAELDQALRAGAELWVDEFSLAQRGLAIEALVPEARTIGMAEVAGELLADDTKVVWH